MFSSLMAMFTARRVLPGAMISVGRRRLFAGPTAGPMPIG
jgi:hypothetical protein